MIAFCRKNRGDLLLVVLGLWFYLSTVSASYYFITGWALFLKVTYLSIICLALGLWFLKNKYYSISRFAFTGIILTSIGVLGSVWTSPFPTRAASDLDIIFASIALAYILKDCICRNFVNGIRSVGVTLFIFTHYALALYAASEHPDSQLTQWQNFFYHTLCNPIILLYDVFCSHGLLEQPFGYSNFSALFAAMLFPFFTGLLCWEKSRAWKTLWIFALLWDIGLLKLSDSRSGYLCVFIVVSLWFIYFIIKQCRKFNRKHVMMVCTLLLTGLLVLLFNSEIRQTFGLIFHGKIKSLLDIRYYLGMDGLTLAREHPWFGWGGTTAPLFYLKSFPAFAFQNWHLHVNPVQILMEFGTITALGLAILIAAYLRMGWQILSAHISAHEKYLTQGVLGSFLTYWLFFTDCSWCTFVLTATFCLISSLLFVLYKKNIRSSKISPCKKTIASGMFALLLLNTVICSDWQELLGRYKFDAFLQAVYHKPQTMLEKLEEAIQVYPQNLYFYNQGASLIAGSGYPFHIPRMRNAIRYFENSLKLNPWQNYPHECLGALYERCGNHVESAKHYLADIEFLPNNSLSYIQLIGLLKQWYPMNDLIDQWLGLAVFNEPRLLALGHFNRWYYQSPKAQAYTWAYHDRYPAISFQRAALAILLRNQKRMIEQKTQIPRVMDTLAEKTLRLNFSILNLQNFTLGNFVKASDRVSHTFGPYAYPEDGVKYHWDRYILRGSAKDPKLMIPNLVALIMPVTPSQRKWFGMFNKVKDSDAETHMHARELIAELKDKTIDLFKKQKPESR